MGNSNVRVREDEMWCPECGAPIKKGFLTCSNCRLKVKMTGEINKKQDKKDPSGKTQDIKTASDPGKNPLNRSGHPRYWNF